MKTRSTSCHNGERDAVSEYATVLRLATECACDQSCVTARLQIYHHWIQRVTIILGDKAQIAKDEDYCALLAVFKHANERYNLIAALLSAPRVLPGHSKIRCGRKVSVRVEKSVIRGSKHLLASRLLTQALRILILRYSRASWLYLAMTLYIAAPLMLEHVERDSSYKVQHVVGNVGGHGLLLLVPPPSPQILSPSIENWRHIEHAPFTGQIKDTFKGTSLHLSFTDWSMHIDLDRGQHDAKAYVNESLVSVHGNGRWIC